MNRISTLCNLAARRLEKISTLLKHKALGLTKVKTIASLYETQADVCPSTSIFDSHDKVA